MNQKIDIDDEIDLKKLFSILWKGKIFIVFISVISIFFASMYLQTTEKKYTVVYKLKPVSENKSTIPTEGITRIASIADFLLPSYSNNDFKIFRELITSKEVSEIIFQNQELIRKIYRKEWNEDTNKYLRPQKSDIEILIDNYKEKFIGSDGNNYMPPNARRLANYIKKNVIINEEKGTGFLKFSSQTSQPELILSLILEATKASDKIMRQRYIEFSVEPLAFYKGKLRTARSREHRESLAQLIAKEEQKLMFASRGEYFIAEPYINPTITLHPTAPNPKLILSISLVLGLFFGAAIILIRSAMWKESL